MSKISSPYLLHILKQSTQEFMDGKLYLKNDIGAISIDVTMDEESILELEMFIGEVEINLTDRQEQMIYNYAYGLVCEDKLLQSEYRRTTSETDSHGFMVQ